MLWLQPLGKLLDSCFKSSSGKHFQILPPSSKASQPFWEAELLSPWSALLVVCHISRWLLSLWIGSSCLLVCAIERVAFKGLTSLGCFSAVFRIWPLVGAQ